MRLAAIALAPLLFACAEAEENSAPEDDLPAGSVPAPGEIAPLVNQGASVQPGQPAGGQLEPEQTEITLRASPEQINAGGTVLLTLVNRSEARLGYNLCTSALQAIGGNAIRTDHECTAEVRTLEPGGSTTYPYDLPGEIRDGRYYFTATVDPVDGGRQVRLTSNPISIQ